MSWIFGKSQVQGNSQSLKNMESQWNTLQALRSAFNQAEQSFAPQYAAMGMQANAGRVPEEVWREMDAQTKVLMRSPNLTLLEDLLPLAKSLPIGKIVSEYRQASDAGNTVTSLSGQVPVLIDKTAYKYDGSIVPVHAVGYGREWREWEGQRSEGFDGLIDDNANATRALRDKMASYIYVGDDSVKFKGYQAKGVKNSDNTKLRDLGASGANINLTASATTGEAIYNEFKAGRDVLRITNDVTAPVTIYVSRAILSNMERSWDAANASNVTILDWVRRLEGVAAVKEDASLSGNEYMVIAVSSEYIRPLVGMATGTYAVQRTMFNDNYNFVIANAVGLEIRADYNGKSGVLYARNA